MKYVLTGSGEEILGTEAAEEEEAPTGALMKMKRVVGQRDTWRVAVCVDDDDDDDDDLIHTCKPFQTTLSAVYKASNLENKHNCVLSNAGLSNALTKTGIWTSLKSGFCFRFHSPPNTKSALPNFICTQDLVLIC